MIEAGLFHLLSTTAALTAIAGTSPTRIYPNTLPNDCPLPAATWSIVGGNQQETWDTSGWQRRRVEFICVGKTDIAANNLRDALIAALNGYHGLLSDGTNLQDCQFINELDAYDHAALEYRRMVEFYFYFT